METTKKPRRSQHQRRRDREAMVETYARYEESIRKSFPNTWRTRISQDGFEKFVKKEAAAAAKKAASTSLTA